VAWRRRVWRANADGAWGNEFIEREAARLGLGRLFGGEVFVRFDLVGELMLLDGAGVAGRFRGAGGVGADRVVEVVGHAVAQLSEYLQTRRIH
jgi:hypothetical protein